MRPRLSLRRVAKGEPNGVVLFFGRIWSKVSRASGKDDAFSVTSANAVAGVRGTEFEVGVADDGSARVIVQEGAVAVASDQSTDTTEINAGFEIESNTEGRLRSKKANPKDPDWDGWFSARARKLEKQGLEVAKDLDGRLNRRKAKLERLVREQKQLRKDIESLEQKKRMGAPVDQALRTKLARLEGVTARLVDMRARLRAQFGIFERWGRIARRGTIKNADQMAKMSENIRKIAADFADMIEEGTDLSEEGMHEMMEDMEKGDLGRPNKNAGDELFE